METLDCIRTRRSVRKYLDKDVSKEVVDKLIDAARHAPFGGPPIPQCQIWEFIVIRDAETKKKLAFDYKDRQYIKTAPVIIAACVTAKVDSEYKEDETIGSLAIENLLLAAHDLGLGACFVDVFIHNETHVSERKTIRDVLKVPENVKVLGLLVIGYPDPSDKIETKTLKDLKDMTHYETW